ncbi:ligand-binding sensor domain-containing protein [Inconstantimicrobium porci]|nr:two-component regulator propeller domain-containing protein [Inconstantimicrobium porci]
MKYYKAILLLLLLFGINMVNIKDVQAYENIMFSSLTIENGLPQSTVETMIQDSKGFIWIGTNDGLARYNGYEFKIYRNEYGKKESLVGNYIVKIVEDRYGYIWVGTSSGVSRINTSDNKILNYTEDNGLEDKNVTGLVLTSDGDVVVATYKGGLHKYDYQKDKFNKIKLKNHKNISSIAKDSNGNIWVAGDNEIDKIDIKNNKVINVYKNNNGTENSIYKIFVDDDDVWIGTTKKGAFKYDARTERVTNYHHDENDNGSIIGDYVRDIYKDSSGAMWFCTASGLSKYDSERNMFINYTNKIYDKHSIINNSTFTILEDKSGFMWVGTYGGISYFDGKNKIEHYKAGFNSQNELSDNMISSVYEDSNGLIWVGTMSKGLNIIDRRYDTISNSVNGKMKYKLSSNSITDIAGYKDEVYIGTSNGLNIINTNTGNTTMYYVKDGLNNSKVRNLFVDNNGYLWIGTSNGFNLMNLKTKEIYDLTQNLKTVKVKDNFSGAIFEDSEGVFWLGSFVNGGLIKLDNKTKKTEVFTAAEGDKGLSNNSIRVIAEDKLGHIWIGTSNGLNMYDKNNHKFTKYTTSDGLCNNTIYGIVVDDDDNIWVSTNSGVSKLSKDRKRFSNFNINDGLQSNEFNGEAYLKTKNGEIVFGGINGLNIFKPESLSVDNFNSKIIFDEIKVNGVVVNDITSKELASSENNISVKIFMPEYRNMRNIQYYYKIGGNYDKWLLINNNELNLSNLSPGLYKLHIKARNKNGDFSDESVVKFSISKPFYMKGVAKLFYIFIIIIFIISSKNKVKKLDREVAKRTNELKKEMDKNTKLLNKVINLEKTKNNYLINLSHELRTPLNVLNSTQQLITELNKGKEHISKERLSYYMSISEKNIERLLHLINNLIDTEKIENGNYNIDIADHDIVYIVEEAALTLKDYIENKGILLVIDPYVEECIIECDSVEIERCIVNLVNNAMKYTAKGGRILVEVQEFDNDVKIVVEDTGIGIEEKYLDTIFCRFHQVVDSNREIKGGSGLGLTITKNIIELHHGKIYVESKVNIGTKFTIILPKKQNNK